MSDPNYNSVSLLLHFDGANGSTTFTDNSPTPKTVTANGNAAISTTQSKFGGASVYLDGNGDYLDVAASSDFNFGTGDFTVEFWFYSSSAATQSPYRRIIAHPSSTNTAGTFQIWQAGDSSPGPVTDSIGLGASDGSATIVSTNTAVTPLGWCHIAFARQSGTVRCFLDGTLKQSVSNATSYTLGGTEGLRLGSRGDLATYAHGYIDDLRITKGVARYTASFTAPTSPFPNSGPLVARAADSGPLGSPSILALVEPRAIALAEGPLGQPEVLGQQSLAYASAPSMLGPEQIVAWHLFARADVPTMLGNANPLAWHLFARADVPSMLGSATPLATHDFTEVIGDATTYYVMDLTTPSGIVRVPISSWQATLQTGLSNYVQCVVPAVSAYVSAINSATQFKISRLVDVPGLAAPLTYEMATAPVQTTTFDQGPFRYTCTISGYSSGFAPNETPPAAYNRIMQGIRSISINQGGRRVRCSIDWLLRPAQRVFASSEEFVVSYINYYVGDGDAYMEVGERA